MGAKVTITVITQDSGQAIPSTQIATPFTLVGFPCVLQSFGGSQFANQWNGQAASGYTANTIPQMKYGFRRISSGLGGSNKVVYKTYWDFAKILGLTRQQYMTQVYDGDTPAFTCQPDENSVNPAVPLVLVLSLSDYAASVERLCTVDIKITQYGRWEGQNADLF